MSKRIIGISGSPIKNSNTDKLLKHVLESSGLEYEFIKLSNINIRPCRACAGCANDSVCIVNDDFPDLAEKIKEADGIIIASYTPMGLIDGHTKSLLERFWSFTHLKDYLKGKYIATIVSSIDDQARQAGHRAIANEAVIVKMKHVDRLDIAGSVPCNICSHGDECPNSAVKFAHGVDAIASADNYIAVETQPVWQKGNEVGKRLANLIEGKEDYIPSEFAQNIAKMMMSKRS